MKNPILNDYEHSITNKIKEFESKPDFPNPSDFGTDKAEVDDYLFDKQAILDSRGNEKTRYTIWGMLFILPVLVLSAFPSSSLPFKDDYALFVGIAIGILLCAIYEIIARAIYQGRLRKLYKKNIEQYLDAIERYPNT